MKKNNALTKFRKVISVFYALLVFVLINYFE